MSQRNEITRIGGRLVKLKSREGYTLPPLGDRARTLRNRKAKRDKARKLGWPR